MSAAKMISRPCTHFNLHRLADGVFAAVHREGGAAFSNAGVVDLGERLLLFDSFETLAAARELRQVVLQETGRLPSWVVNSHSHADHWTGNQVFAGEAVILSTVRTRQGMLSWGADLETRKDDPGPLEREIRELEEKLRGEMEPALRTALQGSLTRRRTTLAELPDFHFCPPEQTFSGRLAFHGSRRTAELVMTGPGHTTEECHLVLAADKVIFTGDLAFFDSPPFLPDDCDLKAWEARLEAFMRMGIDLFVPGHGHPAGREGLERQVRYLRKMRRLVRAQVKAGKDLAEVLRMPMPPEFSGWAGYQSRQAYNLRTLFSIESKRDRTG